jgi:hypothetical protein
MNSNRIALQPLRGALAALAFAAAFAALPSAAHAYGRYAENDTWADGRLVDVQLQLDGDPAPLFWASGHDDRRYFQAFEGQNYSVVLHNNTSRRVGVLLAVDGINAVNGERTHLGNNEAMYVLGPWENTTIRGWRTNLDEVRRFVFVDEKRSYAARTDQANGDMGWLRVLTFKEKTAWIVPDPRQNRDWRFKDDRNQQGAIPEQMAPEAPAPGRQEVAPRAMADNKARAQADGQGYAPNGDSNGGSNQGYPGTGWGQRTQDHVNRTQFNPEYRATDQLVFRYEYESGLRALGIFPDRDRLGDRDSGRGPVGFAKPPRW